MHEPRAAASRFPAVSYRAGERGKIAEKRAWSDLEGSCGLVERTGSMADRLREREREREEGGEEKRSEKEGNWRIGKRDGGKKRKGEKGRRKGQKAVLALGGWWLKRGGRGGCFLKDVSRGALVARKRSTGDAKEGRKEGRKEQACAGSGACKKWWWWVGDGGGRVAKKNDGEQGEEI